jgi:hypothetical protein
VRSSGPSWGPSTPWAAQWWRAKKSPLKATTSP